MLELALTVILPFQRTWKPTELALMDFSVPPECASDRVCMVAALEAQISCPVLRGWMCRFEPIPILRLTILDAEF